MAKGEDFLLEEYKQIAQAFFALHNQKNQLLKYYLTLMTIGTTLISIGLQIIPSLFPSFEAIISKDMLSILVMFLAFLGIIIFNSIVGVRHDMLLYARTVNEVRNYFATKNKQIKSYLVLPLSSLEPSFWESPIRYFFWEVTLVGMVNSSLIVFGAVLADFISFEAITLSEMSKTVPYIVGLTICHHLIYYLLSWLREREFKK